MVTRHSAPPLRASRAALAIAATLGIALPGAAQASTGCTAVNGGVLNHETTFNELGIQSTTAAYSNSTDSYQFVRSNTGYTDSSQGITLFAPNNAVTYDFAAGETINYTATAINKTSTPTMRVFLRYGLNNGATTNAGTPATLNLTTNGSSASRSFVVPANTTTLGIRANFIDNTGTWTGTVQVTATCTPLAAPPTLSSFIYGPAIAYNSTGNTIDVAAGGGATNAPTGYTVSNASGGTYSASGPTSGGGNVSISAGGTATYAPRAGYRGTDTFFVIASNAGGSSAPPAQVTVTVQPPTITASLTGTGAKVGQALTGYAVTPSGGNAPYRCVFNAGSTAPPGVSFAANSCTLIGTPTTPGTYSFGVDITDSSVTGANGGTSSPYTQSNVAIANFTVTQDLPSVTGVSPNIGATAGGTGVTITGTGFYNVQTVTIGGQPLSNLTVVNPATITGNTPAGTGTTNAIVTTAGGASPTGAASQYVYSDPPAAPTVQQPANGGSIGSTTPIYSGVSDANVTIDVVVDGASIGTTTSTPGGMWSKVQPTALGAGSHTVRAVAENAQGQVSPSSATNSFTVTPAPVASNYTVPSVPYNPGGGAAATFSLAGQASNSPTSYAVGSATTANGGSVSIDNAGLVTYTAPSGFRGNDSFVYTATNAGGTSAPATVTLPISNPVLTATLSGSGTRGMPLSAVQIGISGGRPAYSCATTPAAGVLPAGTQINADCSITGTPAASGSFPFQVSMTDSSVGTGPFTQTSSQLTLVVAAPALVLSPAAGALPGATAGQSYSQSFTASSGTAPYNYVLASGALPPGITQSGGTISGTPTTVGTFNFTITATDSATAGSGGPYTVSQSYSITVAPPVITLSPAALADGTIGTAYSASVTASGGTAGYSYAVTGGALPPGITIDPSSGALAGTPTGGGTFYFTLTATDSTAGAGAPYGGSQSYSITVGAPTITLGALTPGTATVGISYSAALSASGGTPGYTYQIVSGALPAGVTLTGDTISGTPTQAGNFTFDVEAEDGSTGAGPYTGTRSYVLSVGAPTITVTPGAVANPVAGVPYSQSFSATGGTAPYSFAAAVPADLPPGLTLSGNTLSGTPSAGGTFSFAITATDSSGGTQYSGSTSYTVTVAPATVVIDQATLPDGRAGTPYSQTLTASGGNGPYSFAVTGGALPPGWNLSTTGVLSGTATASNSYSFAITATDSSGGIQYSGSRNFTVITNSPAFTLTPPTLSASVGQAYSGTFVAGGGTAPYTYQLSTGTLPTGLNLASDGTLSGTPTATGSFNFTVVARDNTGGGGAPYGVVSNFTFTVSVATLSLTPATLQSGRVGSAYSETLSASGGTAPYSYAVTAGAFPAGVTLDPTSGVLSGTPSAGGAFSVTITATDSSGGGGPFSISRGYTLTIDPATITLAPAALPAGTPGTPYSQTLTASGGTAPYAFTATGTLPPGLSLSTGGVVSGTPTAAGSYSFTVAVADASTGAGPYTANQPYTLTIGAPTISVDTASLPNAAVAASYTQTLAASGGVGPYTYGYSGTLPAGVTLSPAGVLSGTPTQGGSFTITVTATDSSGGAGPFSGSRVLTLVVGAPTIALNPAALPAGQMEAAYSQALSAGGGTAPYQFAVTSGALPAGLTLAPDGTLAGTPSVNGDFTFTVTATDSSGGSGPFTGSRAYTLAIAVPNAPVAGAVSANVAYGSSDNAIAPVLSSGTATSVAIAAPPSHGTASASGTNILYTPAPGFYGADSFTYTASNDGGTSPAATVSITVSTPAAPIAGDVSNVAIPYDSSGTPIDLGPSITGVHSAVVIATNPAHGTVSVAGDVVTYIPTAGYFGADVFSYSATGPGGSSNIASVTVQVAIPPAPVAGNVSNVAVPYDSSGTAIDLTSAITGVHSSVAIATNPGHGTVSVAGNVVTYIPTAGYYGTDSFTYTATGPGGTSSPGTVTVQVAVPAAPVAGGRSNVAVDHNSAGTVIDLAPSITGVYSAITIVTPPAQGSATVSGAVVTYTPAAGYYGADSFTYSATGPGGTSAAATVELAIDTPPPPAATPGSGSVAGSTSTGGMQSVDIDLSALVSGDYDRIEIQTQPAHGTVTLSGNPAAARALRAGPRVVATYRPDPGFVGADSFTFVAVGPGGTSPPASVTINVVGVAPTAQAKTAQIGDGQTVSVDLTAGATEGPFTAAAIVGITPADAASATIVASGAGAARSYRLDVTPAARFGGTVVIAYTLTNAYGTSAPATVTVTVTARPDPSADPAVRALSDAQAEATRRFARGQVGNFMRRAEQLHDGGGSAGHQMGISINSRDGSGVYRDDPARDDWAREITDRMTPSSGDPALGAVRAARASGAGMGLPGTVSPGVASARAAAAVPEGGAGAAPDGDDDAGGPRRIGSVAIWSGGAIDIGTRDQTSRRSKITATTAGLSAGVDIKLAESLTLGVGGGYSHDLSRIPDNGARITADGGMVAAYASLMPFEHGFIDGMIGRGDLSFGTRRNAANGDVASGKRDGNYIVGALAFGIDRTGETLRWSLYGRGEVMEADLHNYVETGAGRYNLRFDARHLSSLTGTLGTRIELRQLLGIGVMLPRVRAEWSHEFADADIQRLDYADIPGTAFYGIGTQGWTRDQFDVTIGTRLMLPSLWSIDLESGLRTGQGETAAKLRLQLSREF